MNPIIQGHPVAIRRCRVDEYTRVGRMIVETYAALPGMPQPDEQPDYYSMLRDVERRDRNPAIRVFVAVNRLDEAVGSIDFIADMRQYGSGGSAGTINDAAGVRLLAVRHDCRGAGIGTALTHSCIEQARALRKQRVLLHTTRVMHSAWRMYERLGFARFPQIDFMQGSLEVFGFQLPL